MPVTEITVEDVAAVLNSKTNRGTPLWRGSDSDGHKLRLFIESALARWRRGRRTRRGSCRRARGAGKRRNVMASIPQQGTGPQETGEAAAGTHHGLYPRCRRSFGAVPSTTCFEMTTSPTPSRHGRSNMVVEQNALHDRPQPARPGLALNRLAGVSRPAPPRQS
jgi:hypothetical protein